MNILPVKTSVQFLASFPGLLTPAFVTCTTASDKRWGENPGNEAMRFLLRTCPGSTSLVPRWPGNEARVHTCLMVMGLGSEHTASDVQCAVPSQDLSSLVPRPPGNEG